MTRTHRTILAAAAAAGIATLLWAQPSGSGPGKPAQPDGGKQAAGGHADDHHPTPMPGPEHARLMKLAGRFDVKSKMIMGKDAPPQESAGTATLTSVLGGRFLQEEDSGEMMGQPFSSLKLWGYNVDSKHYEAVWTYTGATSMMRLKGDSRDGGNTVAFTGAYDSAKGSDSFTITMKITGDDQFTVTMTATDPAAGGATFESTYTRKK